MLNQTIQSFTIGKELGSGGMATVYLAENRIGKKVAIKVLAKEHFHNEQIRLRFEQEARVMASLNHENICSVIDLEENDEFSAIIMEYLEGVDLGQYVNQHGSVPVSQVMDWLWQIASGLDYAHSQGYVHRDIKPSNFFLTEKGQIKIMDFGIAKAEDSLVKSQTSSKMGSVAYMSPEQIISTKHVDHKTDIYSLGVTLHHLLGGRVPYDSTTQSRHDIEQRIISEPLPVLPISGSMQAILEKATEKDREARPDTVAALLGATGDDTLLERKPAGTSDKTIETGKKTAKDDKTLIEPADDDTLLENKEATTKAGTGPKPPQKPKPESPPAKATASKAPVKPVLIVALILLLVLGGVWGYAAYTPCTRRKSPDKSPGRRVCKSTGRHLYDGLHLRAERL